MRRLSVKARDKLRLIVAILAVAVLVALAAAYVLFLQTHGYLDRA